MGKYKPLTKWLSTVPSDEVTLTFEKLENILGATLPPSTYKYHQWWANEQNQNRSQARGWLDAGFEVVNNSQILTSHKAVFSKIYK